MDYDSLASQTAYHYDFRSDEDYKMERKHKKRMEEYRERQAEKKAKMFSRMESLRKKIAQMEYDATFSEEMGKLDNEK